MNKKAFTLIELIFVIVIIGVLASVAVPKFNKVFENSKISVVNGFLSTARTTFASSALNYYDLNQNPINGSQLENFFKLNGNDVVYDSSAYGSYSLKNDDGTEDIIKLELNADTRTLQIDIDCNAYNTSALRLKCKEFYPNYSLQEFISY